MTAREQNYVELRTGDYWRARRALPREHIAKGMVLLLESIRDVDRQAHTIILRAHPSIYDRPVRVPVGGKGGYTYKSLTEHRFLVDQFLLWFEPVSAEEAAAIRAAEVAAIQQQINDLQADMREAQEDPDVMRRHLAKQLGKWDAEHAAAGDDQPQAEGAALTIRMGMTVADVGRMKHVIERQAAIASLQAAWIKERVERIADAFDAMTPYYSEQAAAALSRTEDIQSMVERMRKGVESLDLYVGKDVDVKRLRAGASAEDGEPLTIKQAKLFMDEEFAVWADVDQSFDYSNEAAFLKALARNPSLVEQIFPTVRSVVCMAVTRRRINYGDAWLTTRLNERNKEVFLLVRDGDNLFKVWSPVESHLRANRLFPTRKEMEDIFREKAWYMSAAEEITFRDVRYTDKLAEHEEVALHYKRFLILLAGLDHRLDLFGRFYAEPKGMEFLSERFQLCYMRLIHDDEQTELRLAGERRPPFDEWRDEMNAYLRSGSRVIVDWNRVMASDTAPAAVRVGPPPSYREEFAYRPEEDFSVKVVYREGNTLCVKVRVSGNSYRGRGRRSFAARVDLSRYIEKRGGDVDALLCLDAVHADDLDYYISSRIERQHFLDYIKTFKQAARYLHAEEQRQAATLGALVAALEEGGIARGEDAARLADQAIITWRAANRGAELPPNPSPAYTQLLNQMFELANQEQAIAQAERLATARGLEPLRLVVSGKSTLKLYCAPKAAERDDRLFAHVWVHQLTLKRRKSCMSVRRDFWALLPARSAGETTVSEWKGAAAWEGLKPPEGVAGFEHKQRLFASIDEITAEKLPAILSPEFDDVQAFAAWSRHWYETRRRMNLRGRYVRVPAFCYPMGLIYVERNGQARLRLLAIGYLDVGAALYAKAPTDVKSEMEADYLSLYANKEHVRNTLHEKARDRHLALYLLDTGSRLTSMYLTTETLGRPEAYVEPGGVVGAALVAEMEKDRREDETVSWHLAAPFRPAADQATEAYERTA